MPDNKDKKVRVEYTGYIEGETEPAFSSDENNPLEFTCMAGEVFPAIDTAVREMSIGETREIYLEAREAFGEPTDEKIQEIPSNQIAGGTNLPVGETLQILDEQYRPVSVKVVAVNKEQGTVTIDYNHPFAGKNLRYVIRLLGISL